MGRLRPVQDGGGLCSPGRWARKIGFFRKLGRLRSWSVLDRYMEAATRLYDEVREHKKKGRIQNETKDGQTRKKAKLHETDPWEITTASSLFSAGALSPRSTCLTSSSTGLTSR